MEKKEVIVEEKKKENIENKNVKCERKSNNLGVIVLTAFITFVITFGCCYVVLLFQEPLTNEVIKEQRQVTITDTGIADAVEKIYDSVVVINVYKNNTAYSSATGFVFEKNNDTAYIMTNAHVVNGGDKYTATFTNKKVSDLKLIGSDTYADIAVLSVNAKDVITVAEIGDSESMRLGDTTFTIGAPIDSVAYSWTVTRGVLSGKNREVEVSSSNNLFSNDSFVLEVLQTDAPINSGNSGGPLCNANGNVIGVTNMKLSSSTIEGIGFAIPIETAMEYASTFITGKKVERPYLGVGVYYVSPLYYNVKYSGVYVEQIEENGPASKSQLKVGDIINKIDGVEVKSVAYFKFLLYKYKVGDTITLSVYRNNQLKEIKAKLGTSTKLN